MCRKMFLLTCFAAVLSMLCADAAFGLVWEAQIGSGGDDVEEHIEGGSIDTGSSDIEMPYDDEGNPPTDPQLVALRFQNVEVPAGAIILNAWIQFTSDNEYLTGGPVNLAIWGHLVPNATQFTATGSISAAPRTTVHAKWSDLPDWTSGASGPEQQTSDISAVIEELVNQPGWAVGNALGLIIGDDPDNPSRGIRSALTGTSNGAILHIEYTSMTAFNPNPANGEDPVLRVFLDERAEVEIEIFDVTGQVVDRIEVDGVRGPQDVRWDVSNIASGLYIVRMEARRPGANAGIALGRTVESEVKIMKVAVVR